MGRLKIHIEHGDFEENEVVLRCRALDEEMLELLALLRNSAARLAAAKDGEIHMLLPAEVCFAEAVDGKTFLYTADMVLESGQSLSALQTAHQDAGFLRIGKSQLVNLYHVAKLKSMVNTRIELTLKNGERLIVSRHFVQSLKEKLGLLNREEI